MEKTKVLMKDVFNSKGIITVTEEHSAGKSCFVANIVKQALYDNKVVALFSSEYIETLFFNRLISLITNVGFIDLGEIKKDEWEKACVILNKITKNNLHFSNTKDIEEIISSIENLVNKLEQENKKIDLIVIDSLTYLTNNRYKTVCDVFKHIKEELKEFNIPVIITYPISSNEIRIPKNMEMNPTEEETKFIKDNSNIFIFMERTVELTIDYHQNKIQTIEYKFNASTGEFTEK